MKVNMRINDLELRSTIVDDDCVLELELVRWKRKQDQSSEEYCYVIALFFEKKDESRDMKLLSFRDEVAKLQGYPNELSQTFWKLFKIAQTI